MKILVIGGSYFLGRMFTIESSKENELTLVNRGTHSMKEFGLREFKVDRNDEFALKELPKENYDAVVDFCIHKNGDITRFIENYKGKIGKYVLISTIDVYQKRAGIMKTETSLLQRFRLEGEEGKYIEEKIQLEKELLIVCAERNIQYKILRPSIIYGPHNYVPRESEYIRRLLKKEEIPMPVDSESEFQLVYIKDVANAIIEVLKKDESKVYNVCPEVTINYKSFFELLTKVSGIKPIFKKMTTMDIYKTKEFAPFPLMSRETNLCDGTKIVRECDFRYTSLEEGMEKNFNAFKNIYLS